jgi:hypothetical protein
MFRFFDFDWLLKRQVNTPQTFPIFLPSEVWASICSMLTPQTVIAVSLTSKSMYQVTIWELD